MKNHLLFVLAVSFAVSAPAAQDSATGTPTSTEGGKPAVDASGTNEVDRLRQLYMAKRAELLALRSAASQAAKSAQSDEARLQIQQQLAAAEKPIVAQAVDLVRQYAAARKQKLGAVIAPQR